MKCKPLKLLSTFLLLASFFCYSICSQEFIGHPGCGSSLDAPEIDDDFPLAPDLSKLRATIYALSNHEPRLYAAAAVRRMINDLDSARALLDRLPEHHSQLITHAATLQAHFFDKAMPIDRDTELLINILKNSLDNPALKDFEALDVAITVITRLIYIAHLTPRRFYNWPSNQISLLVSVSAIKYYLRNVEKFFDTKNLIHLIGYMAVNRDTRTFVRRMPIYTRISFLKFLSKIFEKRPLDSSAASDLNFIVRNLFINESLKKSQKARLEKAIAKLFLANSITQEPTPELKNLDALVEATLQDFNYYLFRVIQSFSSDVALLPIDSTQ
jgi:hypothetical protein